MGDATKIEWTDATWNPVRGCSRVSEGCRHCYAEIMAARFSGPGMWGEGFAHMVGGDHRWTGKVELVESQMDLPLRWRDPRRIFVNSTSDLFHEGLSFPTIGLVVNQMRNAHWHTYQVLTKRSARLRQFAEWWTMETTDPLPRNLWLGVSVEDQNAADARIPDLLATPAPVRFLSCEPLLGPLDLSRWMPSGRFFNAICEHCGHTGSTEHFDLARGHDDADVVCPKCHRTILANEIGTIDWVIAGGESGSGARPMHPHWARRLRDVCAASGVPFFFKQWGEWFPGEVEDRQAFPDIDHDPSADRWEFGFAKYKCIDGAGMLRVGKQRAGRRLDGVEHNEFPRSVH